MFQTPVTGSLTEARRVGVSNHLFAAESLVVGGIEAITSASKQVSELSEWRVREAFSYLWSRLVLLSGRLCGETFLFCLGWLAQGREERRLGHCCAYYFIFATCL